MFQTQQTLAVTPAQLDIGDIINTIMPLFTLMMVFGLLMPMMKQMGGAFGESK